MIENNQDKTPAKIWGLIPAGGQGARMAASVPKQYLELAGKTLIHHAVLRLCAVPEIEKVWVGISATDTTWAKIKPANDKLAGHYMAGEQRFETVLNGLGHLLQQGALTTDWVLVHDAVRPCVRKEDIQRLIAKAIKTGHGGILAKPVVETIKQVNDNQAIIKTLDREQLRLAATPQMFKIGDLKHAIEVAKVQGLFITDEASAMENSAYTMFYEPCGHDNIKITYPMDMLIAERILEKIEKESL